MGTLRKRGGVWWIRYSRNGKREEESSHSATKQVAIDLLKIREGDVAKGVPVSAKAARFTFNEGVRDLLNDYRINDKRSLDDTERRVSKHLEPFFGGRRLASITTSDVRAYVASRLAATETVRRAYPRKLADGTVREIPEHRRAFPGASHGAINRELTALKRLFSLAMQSGKVLHKPYIPLLRENNTRTGFFEYEQFLDVREALPDALRPVVEFAYITGWRVTSEILPLQWRNVDFDAGEIRLDVGTTKNDEGRVFPMTDDLRALLEGRHAEHVKRRKAGQVVPWVFFRMVAKGRGGEKSAKPIRAFAKAWKSACEAAGCPGRIPHDFRRTAARNMIRRGVPERVAMKLTGHKTRSIFDRYNVTSDGDLRAAATQLGGLTSAPARRARQGA